METLYKKNNVTMYLNSRCHGVPRYEVHHNTLSGIKNYVFTNLGDAYRQYNLLLRD